MRTVQRTAVWRPQFPADAQEEVGQGHIRPVVNLKPQIAIGSDSADPPAESLASFNNSLLLRCKRGRTIFDGFPFLLLILLPRPMSI